MPHGCLGEILPLAEAGCDLKWCEPFEVRMRSFGVLVDHPFFDHPAGLRQPGKQVVVEALVAEPALE